MNRLLLSFLALALARPLLAHDFWIEPSTYRPRAGEAVTLRLLQGEHFRGEAVARNDQRIERFTVRDGGGERTISGTNGSETAGRITPPPGVAIVAYRSFPRRHGTMAAAAFEAYLREEGLERIIDLRARRGEAKQPASEMFSRSAKALVRGTGHSATRYDEVLGLRFEIIPETDPHAPDASPLTFRLVFDGKPLPGALVTAIDGRGTARKARSDAQGRASFSGLAEGVWLVKSVHMLEAPEGSGAQWESVWATLTFERKR